MTNKIVTGTAFLMDDVTNRIVGIYNLDGTTSLFNFSASTTTTTENSVTSIVTASVLTRPADTTAYAFGDLIANSVTAGSVVAPSTGNLASAADALGTILRVRLITSSVTVAGATFRIHLYNALPTVTNGDNGAWLSTQSGYQGSFDVTVDKAFSDGAEGIGYPTIGYGGNFIPASGARNLFYLIEMRGAAYTPTSAETFTPIFEVQ